MLRAERILVRPLMAITMAGCSIVQTVCLAQEDLPPIIESQPIAQSPPVVSRNLPLDARVTRLESLLDDQTLLDMLQRLDELQKEVQELRGSVEVQGHDIDGIKQHQRDLYLDIDRRLRQFETSGTAATPPAATSDVTPSSSSPGDTASSNGGSGVMLPGPQQAQPVGGSSVAPGNDQNVDSLAEQTDYQKAFNLLKEGRYDEAISEFNAFLSHYPNGQFSSNAQYWLGEANYVTRRFPAAVEEFNKVLESYPDSNKVPDAMLKLGFSYYELSDWEHTNSVLNQLVQRFPSSTAAQLAQNRLHRMKLEGR